MVSAEISTEPVGVLAPVSVHMGSDQPPIGTSENFPQNSTEVIPTVLGPSRTTSPQTLFANKIVPREEAYLAII